MSNTQDTEQLIEELNELLETKQFQKLHASFLLYSLSCRHAAFAKQSEAKGEVPLGSRIVPKAGTLWTAYIAV